VRTPKRDKEDLSSAVECFKGRRQEREGVLVSCMVACCSTTKMMEREKLKFNVSLAYWMVCMTLYFSGGQKEEAVRSGQDSLRNRV